MQKDAYTKTGCINLLCSGFVQTTTKFALGAAIEPVSRARGDQYYMAFSMYLVTCYNLYYMIIIFHILPNRLVTSAIYTKDYTVLSILRFFLLC